MNFYRSNQVDQKAVNAEYEYPNSSNTSNYDYRNYSSYDEGVQYYTGKVPYDITTGNELNYSPDMNYNASNNEPIQNPVTEEGVWYCHCALGLDEVVSSLEYDSFRDRLWIGCLFVYLTR
jgi:hypothetical protein